MITPAACPSATPVRPRTVTTHRWTVTVRALRRAMTTVVAALSVLLILPAAAHAYVIAPEPARVVRSGLGNGTIPQTVPPETSSSGWGLTAIVAIAVAALLAVGVALLLQRAAHHRQVARTLGA